MRKIGFLLIIIGIIGMAFNAKHISTDEMTTEVHHIPSEYVNSIIVESNLADVTVLPSDSEDVKITRKGKFTNNNKYSLERLITVDETKKVLLIKDQQRSFFNISFLDFGISNEQSVKIYLPKKEYNTFQIKNDAGDTTIQNLSLKELISKNDVGDLTVEHIDAASIHSESDVGNINLINNRGQLKVENDVGNIKVITEAINNDMDLQTDVGNIDLEVKHIPEDVTFSGNSSVGSVRIFGEKGSYPSRDTKYIVTMTSDVGNITVTDQ